MVRPANRRKCHHKSAGHGHLCKGFAAAFKLVEQHGNQGNAERGQGVEAELEGCALQTEVHEPTLDGNIIHEVNVAHAGGVRDC